MSQTEIKYGRIELDGKIVGYATYELNGTKVEIINIPYEGLFVKIDGEIKYKPGDQGIEYYVMIWTKVAGWLGSAEMVAKMEASR